MCKENLINITKTKMRFIAMMACVVVLPWLMSCPKPQRLMKKKIAPKFKSVGKFCCVMKSNIQKVML